MGAVTVKLGVSSATIAFITRIYDELIHSLRAIDRDAVKLLFQLKVAYFWEKINGNFFASVVAGILMGILLLTSLVAYTLQHYAIPACSFFFGLILISSTLVLREIKNWNFKIVLAFFIGVTIAYTVTVLPPTQFPNNLFFAFLSGFLASCGAAVPGISGASVMLFMGEYQYIINALINFDFIVIGVFTVGCLIGLIIISRILTWILNNYPNSSLALLAGLTLGSLNKVWPWRAVLEYITNSKGEQVPVFDKSILPWDYVAVTGKDPLVFQAIFMMALGVFIVVLIEKVALRLKTKN